MSYRIEISPNKRAGCQATNCKDEGVKIEKGDLRQGTLVDFKDHQSMKYRHWGCVTPTVINNWREACEMDMELVDGYDDLPEAAQEKVKRALEQGHVDDEDWNGDVECNRHTGKRSQGMFLKGAQKKKNATAGDSQAEEPPAKKTETKKRGRGKQEDNDEADAKPAAKKAKAGKKTAAKEEPENDEESKPAPATQAKKGKKAVKQETSDEETMKPAAATKTKRTTKVKEEDTAEVPAPPAKTTKGRKAKAAPAVASEGEEDEAVKPAPKKRATKAKPAPAATSETEPADEAATSGTKKSRVKKGTTKAAETDDGEGKVVKAKLQAKSRARGKKAAAADGE